MKQLKNTEDLLNLSLSYSLYPKLVEQLDKDFSRAAIDLNLPNDISPKELKLKLHEKIITLIQKHYSDYLNLLYIIDVPEELIKQLEESDNLIFAERVSYLILKREWQKVWYRNKGQIDF